MAKKKKVPYSAVVETITFWQDKLNLRDVRIDLLTTPPGEKGAFLEIMPQSQSDRSNFRISGSQSFWTKSTPSERFYGIGHELLHVCVWPMQDALDVSAAEMEEKLFLKIKRRYELFDERVVLKLENVIRKLVPIPPELEKRLSNSPEKDDSL